MPKQTGYEGFVVEIRGTQHRLIQIKKPGRIGNIICVACERIVMSEKTLSLYKGKRMNVLKEALFNSVDNHVCKGSGK